MTHPPRRSEMSDRTNLQESRMSVPDAEVDAIAEAVFDLEANPQRWSTTTESMRAIYRASIRKALVQVRAERIPPKEAENG